MEQAKTDIADLNMQIVTLKMQSDSLSKKLEAAIEKQRVAELASEKINDANATNSENSTIENTEDANATNSENSTIENKDGEKVESSNYLQGTLLKYDKDKIKE